MLTNDKQYLANIFNRISQSVTTVNEGILAHRQGKLKTEDLMMTTMLEQLAIQQETLIVLAMMVTDPNINAEDLPNCRRRS